MDNIKNDTYYVKKMLKDINFIIMHTKTLSLNELETNEILCDSVLFRLIQISETSAKLSDAFKTEHNDIPWQAIKGMRNKIVHEYGEVKLDIVYDTVSKDIPYLYSKLNNL